MNLTAQAEAALIFGRMAGRPVMRPSRGQLPSEPESGAGTQRVVMLETADEPSPMLTEVCTALDVEVIHLASHHDLPFTLHHRQPMAVVVVVNRMGPDICQALRSIASFDRTLPVLVITADDPACLGIVDASEQLWRLTGLSSSAEMPDMGYVVDFLFRAGRKGQVGRLLPV